MGPLKELSTEQIWAALEGQQDLLSGEVKKEEAVFRNTPCPECRGFQHSPFIFSTRPFSPLSALPKKHLRCLDCGCEFDPETRLVTKASASPNETDALTGR